MNKANWWVILLVSVLLFGQPQIATAEPILDLSGGDTFNYPYVTLGWEFDLTAMLSADALRYMG